jgi:hypothetical protein
MSSVCFSSTGMLVVFLVVLVFTLYLVSLQAGGQLSCPPCRDLICTIPASAGIEATQPPVVVPAAPPAPEFRKPERQYVSAADVSWQEMGFVKSPEMKQPLRLFARRKWPRSERYEYFLTTRDNISIPFNTPKDVELVDGDHITVPGFKESLTATIYPVSAPRYM